MKALWPFISFVSLSVPSYPFLVFLRLVCSWYQKVPFEFRGDLSAGDLPDLRPQHFILAFDFIHGFSKHLLLLFVLLHLFQVPFWKRLLLLSWVCWILSAAVSLVNVPSVSVSAQWCWITSWCAEVFSFLFDSLIFLGDLLFKEP